jgi:chromosome segregation ATPase
MLTLLVALNGLTLIVLIWILTRSRDYNYNFETLDARVGRIVSELDDMNQKGEHLLNHLYSIRELLEKIESKPVPRLNHYDLIHGISEEFRALKELAEKKESHISSTLDEVSGLYEKGVPEEEYMRKLEEHPYHRSEQVGKWLWGLELENYCRAYVNNVRRLLDTDAREGDWASKRAKVEEALDTLRKFLDGLDSLELEELVEWDELGGEMEGLDHYHSLLDSALRRWLEEDLLNEDRVEWKSPINGETTKQFLKKVNDDADELRIEKARLRNPT